MAGGLKEVRERIKSVINTQQITKAMKMVSAAKLRRAQQNIQQVRPYADRLNRMLSNILSNLDGDASTSFGKSREVKNTLLVVMTSNRGLCGAFNTNLGKETASLIREKYAQQQRSISGSVFADILIFPEKNQFWQICRTGIPLK
jgi:F-type H+-transporting ATPase subunit gamma